MKDEIKTLIYQNLFNEHRLYWTEDEDEEAGDPEVVRHLIRAYIAVCATEACGEHEVQTQSGDEAWMTMQLAYVIEFKKLSARVQIKLNDESIAEGFEWPDVMPRSEDIPVGMLKATGRRLAAYDVKVGIELRNHYKNAQLDKQ